MSILVICIQETATPRSFKMKTLTLFIEQLYIAELGSTRYQSYAKITIKSNTYSNISISGSMFKEVVFQDIIFLNCNFFGSTMDNCLFINCMFLNCKFQFSTLSDCNFESTTWENCMWGLTTLKNSVIENSEVKNNYSFESSGIFAQTQTLNLSEFLTLSA
jgi:uncharacterized protein YjbI with pentapeptide repeats